MTDGPFELRRSERVEALNLTVEEYFHKVTGARHIHLAADDDNNAFLVAFLTVPQDSTGVAHILEHTALCGSERFPVRDPFFLMLRRSLNTFMNAMTASDWTAYPFASCNRKDYFNLLDVYLDAAFFPKLDELDFAQEGHRLEFAEAGNADSELVYKGVVYNEMKGAMSSPVAQLWQKLAEDLYPTTTYHYNSGGDPAHIPDLSYEQLKAFHARHYHPSNAVFFTYGDIPAAEHQQVFEARALSRFQPLDVDFRVPPEQRYDTPRQVHAHYPAEDGETARRTHIVLGWLLGEITDLDKVLEANLLARVLLDNSSSPLLHALETTALGTAPSPLCGLDDSSREMAFAAGVEGSEPEHAEAVEALVFEVLEQVARDGVPQEQVEAVLHQIELSRREVGGDRFPYGLQLIMTALPPAIHDGDPVAVLAIEDALQRLRESIADPGFVARLARELLLDNPHRVRLVMEPDPQQAQRDLDRERERLRAEAGQLDAQARRRIVERAQALEARQAHVDDPDLLPRVGVEDVAPDLPVPEGTSAPLGDLPATWYDRPTNGLVYEQIVLDLPQLDDELLQLVPLLAEILPEVGVSEHDYQQMQRYQAALTGGLAASASIGGMVDDAQTTRGLFVLSGKALARNHGALSGLLLETLQHARFDELERIRDIIAQMRMAEENSITGQGHALAMSAASAGMSPAARLGHEWGGLEGVRRIKALDDSLAGDAALQALAGRLGALRDALLEAPRQLLVVAEAEQHDAIRDQLGQIWAGAGLPAPTRPALQLPPVDQRVDEIWSANSQVNFCARAYRVVPPSHEDAPALAVLGGFLRNGFLHTAIRERGGAYGGGAGYDGDSACFRFFSYRDPRLHDTLEDFDRSLQWLHEHAHPAHTVEEAILGVISGIDRPSSPAGEAKKAFHGALFGRDATHRRRFRKAVLQVTLEQLQAVAARHLDPARASTAVVSNAGKLDAGAALGLETRRL